MTDAVGSVFELVGAFAVVGGSSLLIAGLVATAPRVLGTFRQRAYDRATSAERQRWLIRFDPASIAEPDAPRRLVAGLHPGSRRAVSGWASGWPELTLALRWADGRARVEIEAPRQLSRAIGAAVAAACPTAELEPIEIPMGPVALHLALRGEPPRVAPTRVAVDLGPALVELMSRLPSGASASWTLAVRPLPPQPRQDATDTAGLGEVVLDSLLNRSPRTPSPIARTAATSEPSFSVA